MFHKSYFYKSHHFLARTWSQAHFWFNHHKKCCQCDVGFKSRPANNIA